MKPTIVLFSNTCDGWYAQYIQNLASQLKRQKFKVHLSHDLEDLISHKYPKAICFILAATQIIPENILSQFEYNIIIHESDLPQGKGWSPLSYQVEEGKNEIVFSAFNANPKVDDGDIVLQKTLYLNGTELFDELKSKQAELTERMVVELALSYPNWKLSPQIGPSSYYPKRNNNSNKLDTTHTLEEIFNKLRVADNDQFPAWFEINGKTYCLKIEEHLL